MAAPALGESALEVTLLVPDSTASPEARSVSVTGRGRWSERAEELTAVLDPVAGRSTR
jgi:hypothetical protein